MNQTSKCDQKIINIQISSKQMYWDKFLPRDNCWKWWKKYPKSSQQDMIPYLSLHLNNSSDSCLLIRHYVVQTEVTYHLSSAKRKELSTQHILSANVLQKPRWNKVLLTYRKKKKKNSSPAKCLQKTEWNS